MGDHTVCRKDVSRLLAHTSALQRVLKDIQNVVCSIDSPTWEEAQEQRHPLWEALNVIDAITLQALTYRIEQPVLIDGEVPRLRADSGADLDRGDARPGLTPMTPDLRPRVSDAPDRSEQFDGDPHA